MNLVSTLGVIAGFFLVIIGGAVTCAHATVALEQRRRLREVEAWRRARPRAALKGILVARNPMTGEGYAIPIFAPGSAARPADADPITGEPIQYGWSESELREVAARPSEFFVE